MAQDRLYIRCSTCGEQMPLVCLGFLCGRDALEPHQSLSNGEMAKWLAEHTLHHPHAAEEFGIVQFGPASQWFTLETESEPFSEL